jgi:hypothetical protein
MSQIIQENVQSAGDAGAAAVPAKKKSGFFCCKNLSNIIKALACVYIICMFLFTTKAAMDIIATAAAMVAFFLPIDASQFLKTWNAGKGKEAPF